MNACPTEEQLLRFLDGVLAAEDDARIAAHVEDCVHCHALLEQLTPISPALRAGPAVETVRNDEPATIDLTKTDLIVSANGDDDPGGEEYRKSKRTDSGTPGSCLAPPGDPELTADYAEGAAAIHDGNTDEASRDGRFGAEDASRSATAAVIEPVPQRTSRNPAAGERPAVDGYDVRQCLGEGGMGVVYKARHLGLNRLVALKMIRGGSQARPDYIARFRVEAEAVAQIRHPNIIQIYDIGQAEGLPFVALELLDGGGLDDRLGGNPQPGRQAAELLITLARAVHVAHQSGIIHRDLKPTNVLYTSDGVPKITDFGLAKRIDSDGGQTQSGQIMGSPSYMAPEQARGHSRNVGPAADVYALGAILYEMLTGRAPFKGETPIETIRQVIDDDPVTPSRLVPRVPRDLETICLKCLHKDPARRYESAAALADDLARYLRGEPIRGRRVPPWERGAKWAYRRPVAAMLLLAVIAAIPISFLVVLDSQRRRNDRERAATARIMGKQDDGMKRMLRARDALAKDELNGAEVTLTGLKERIQGEPKLRDLNAAADALLVEVKARQAERVSRESDRSRYAEFRRLRNDALFHDTRFTGLDLTGNQDATRRAARAALELYAADGAGDSWSLRPLPASLTAPERAEIAEACYELLLILGEAEAMPQNGLRRLDQAARLRPPTRAYHLRRAACLARTGDKPGADRERLAADAQKPVSAFDHFLAGQERFERQDFDGASQEFDMALQLQPDHFWAQASSAVCSLQLNQPVEAKASLNACLQREPRFAWLYILRGFASSEIARIARDLVERRPEPGGLVGRVDRLYAAADSDYRKAQHLLDRGSSELLRYSLLVNRGVLRLLLRRDLDEAVEQLQAAIKLNPQGLEAHAALARVFQSQGRQNEALEQFSRAIALRPREPALYRDRADVDLSRAQPTPAQRSRALCDLEQAIRLEKPGSPLLARDHFQRARLLELDHRDTEALAACDEAIKVARGNDDVHRLRIELLLRLRRNDNVIRSCDAIIASGKPTARICELRGLAREEIKDFSGAIEDFTNAMALRGNRAVLLRRRGWIYIVVDAPRLALDDFEASIQLDGSSGDAYNGRGAARLRFGQHREAVADAEKALSLGEPKPDLYYKAARVYAVAAIAAGAELRKKGEDTVALVSRYQDRAADLLFEALKRLPPERRASFRNDVILTDPQLRTLRRRVLSLDLAGSLPKPTAAGAASSH